MSDIESGRSRGFWTRRRLLQVPGLLTVTALTGCSNGQTPLTEELKRRYAEAARVQFVPAIFYLAAGFEVHELNSAKAGDLGLGNVVSNFAASYVDTPWVVSRLKGGAGLTMMAFTDRGGSRVLGFNYDPQAVPDPRLRLYYPDEEDIHYAFQASQERFEILDRPPVVSHRVVSDRTQIAESAWQSTAFYVTPRDKTKWARQIAYVM